MSISELSYRMGKSSAQDTAIEKMIDKAGREEVFSEARRLGWGDETPPSWVWKHICADIMHRKAILQGSEWS